MFSMGARWAKCSRSARDEELQTQLGMIKTGAEEIEGLGRRFYELDPRSTDCLFLVDGQWLPDPQAKDGARES